MMGFAPVKLTFNVGEAAVFAALKAMLTVAPT